MHIGIIGTGAMGSALGKLWAKQGHTVTFSYSRNPAKLEQLVREAGQNARAGTPQEAAAADVILISVLWGLIDDALAAAGSLKDEVVVDCMLPMTADDSALAIGHTTSGGEELAKKSGARVVKAFNQIFSDVLAADDRKFGADTPTMFYCGDDSEAKKVVADLIGQAGFEPVDAGRLERARLLEPLGLLIGVLALEEGLGEQIGLKLLRR
ncbi:MAG: transmembrane reductase oxidoreductase [Anaerolineaceae bacterium]|nr:transmembrane reductase oxidoreductase [Anaerolineaceae bacterium]